MPYTMDTAMQYVTKCVPMFWQDGSEFSFAVEAAHDDGVRRYAGSVSLRPHGDGVAEIAYGVHPAARSRGVCGRAVNLLLDWGFRHKGYEVVVWYAQVGNWASRRVAWATGFSIDGMVPKLLVQRGVRRDAWVGSLRADEPREPKHPWHVPPVLESDRLRLRPPRETDAACLGEITYDDRSRHFMSRVTALRGRGVTTEALRMVTEWAFRPVAGGGLGKRRLWLSTAESNAASRHAAERAGFVHITTEPETFTIGDERFEGRVVYHQLNPAWCPATAARG